MTLWQVFHVRYDKLDKENNFFYFLNLWKKLNEKRIWIRDTLYFMHLSYSYPKMQTSPWSDTSKSRYWFASDYANVLDGCQTGSNIKILSSVSHIYFVQAITNMLTPSWSDTTRSRYWVHKWLCKFPRWPPNRKLYRKSVFNNFTFILEKLLCTPTHLNKQLC